MEAVQAEMKTKMDMHQQKMETAIHSIRSELEETIKHRVEDVPQYAGEEPPGNPSRQEERPP